MNSADAEKTVLAVVLIVGAVVFWESITNTGRLFPPFKTMVTLLVLSAGLMVGADLAPGIVGPLSVLIGIGIVITRFPSSPGPFITNYGGGGKNLPGSAPRPASPPSSNVRVV